MARTVDELVVKMSVEGTAQINTAATSMDNLDSATKKTSDTLKSSQGNIRNVAFQVQDMAVQIAGGTSAFVALGQQLPQLLGGFGVLGAVIGAVAAIGIPLARVGLQAMGVDMRDLGERTKDLTDSVKGYQSAQQANQPTLVGLGNTYGVLTGSAKDFFDIQEKLKEQKVNADLSATLQKLKTDYRAFSKEAEVYARSAEAMNISRGGSEGTLFIAQIFKSMNLGLTISQAKEVAERIKDIDKASPEQAAKTLNDVLDYLKKSGVEASKFKKFFDETISPLLDINNQILESRKNLKESAEQATKFSSELINGQNAYIDRIGAARRSNDQLTAIRLEREQKIAEVTAQFREKEKDGINRTAELNANLAKIKLESGQKEKDFLKTQQDTVKSSQMNNDAKRRQLILESQILDIQDKGRYDAEYNVKYSEDIARASKEYNDTIINIGEQRRKNLITAEGEKKLQQEAGDILTQSTQLAEQARNKRVRDIQLNQENELMKKNIEDQIAGYQKVGEVLRKINDQKIDIAFTQGQRGKSPLEQQIAQIRENARKAALEAGRAFSEGFTQEDLSAEGAARLANGLKQITLAYKGIADAQIAALGVSKEFADGQLTGIAAIQEQIKSGLVSAWDEYKTKAIDTAGQIKSSFDNFTSGLEDAFVKFVQGGKLSFNDLANSIIADLIRISVRKSIVGLGTLFGFAEGGSPPVGVPSIVGEKGPEIFIPNTAGTIIPNKGLNSTPLGGANVTYNIQAVDAASFRSLVARDPGFIYAVTEQGRRSQPTRRAG
jgi:lambda family phage tail tape measure protein